MQLCHSIMSVYITINYIYPKHKSLFLQITKMNHGLLILISISNLTECILKLFFVHFILFKTIFENIFSEMIKGSSNILRGFEIKPFNIVFYIFSGP